VNFHGKNNWKQIVKISWHFTLKNSNLAYNGLIPATVSKNGQTCGGKRKKKFLIKSRKILQLLQNMELLAKIS